jgi:hypothetical protein
MLRFVALLLMPSGSAYPPDSLGTDLEASIGNGGSVAILPRKYGIWAVSAEKLGCDDTWQIWLKDPDGNAFEVHQYTPKSMQFTGGTVEADW